MALLGIAAAAAAALCDDSSRFSGGPNEEKCRHQHFYPQIISETLAGGEMCFVDLSGGASKYIKAMFVLL